APRPNVALPPLAEREQPGRPALARPRLPGGYVAEDAANLRVRLREADAVGERGDRHDIGDRLIRRSGGRDAERRPELRGEELQRKPRWHHANHGVRLAVQPHASSDDGRIAAEAALPGAVTQHDQAILARLFFVGEDAAEYRRFSREPQHLRVEGCGADHDRFVAGAQHTLGRGERRDVRQRAAAFPEAGEVDRVQGVAIRRVGDARRHQVDVHRPLAALQPNRAKQRGVDGGKQCGVDADDERQRADTGTGIGGTPEDAADGLTKLEHALKARGRPDAPLSHIAHHKMQHSHGTSVPPVPFYRFARSERCGAPRCARRSPAACFTRATHSRRAVHKDSEYERKGVKNQWRTTIIRRYAAAVSTKSIGVARRPAGTAGVEGPRAGERSMRLFTAIACGMGALVALTACSAPSREAPKPPADHTSEANANLADYHNGVSSEDRETFYHLSEGSEMMPLALLQALERPRTAQDPAGDGLLP